MSVHARIERVAVDVDADMHISIAGPHTLTVGGAAAPVEVPWLIQLGHAVDITCDDRGALVALRDALTAALDAHPDDEPEDVCHICRRPGGLVLTDDTPTGYLAHPACAWPDLHDQSEDGA